MKRVGILGGTFDPPHLGHLIIAEEVRLALNLEEVWFIPSFTPPHKDEARTSAAHRMNMLQMAIKNNSSFQMNTIEIERLGKSYTFDTMKALRNEFPENDFHFIIGADMVEYLPHWNKIDELIKLVQFVGVGRPGYQLNTPYPITKVEIPMIEISSTSIRNRLANKETVNYLIPEDVYAYIKEKQLYENK
ncbi:nicotinic acid mononucleotide adenylyltransferase [Virgibacillus profundi]|uniref:Probable nicotinate-nucleotide adenylyltransferase n=1 Tax=Virgibacillus profundi TaxID=2024555 RepID=A0A2A2ID46_9BACI|nr:nicotinate-nucleotide adenylyltransferase [Virgibacillus profundi]PAV28993.1 nicotinic acid mononucleotide adenylyltransferase [Virgibacillus profundi]PXY53161.1 nicotinate-nucleotide adenylyltransferase [Virgibacillus profundi]